MTATEIMQDPEVQKIIEQLKSELKQMFERDIQPVDPKKDRIALAYLKFLGVEEEDILECHFDGMNLSWVPAKPIERITFTGTLLEP